jgi:hypothetical protein
MFIYLLFTTILLLILIKNSKKLEFFNPTSIIFENKVWPKQKEWPWYSLVGGKDPTFIDDNDLFINNSKHLYRIPDRSFKYRDDKIVTKNAFTDRFLEKILQPLVKKIENFPKKNGTKNFSTIDKTSKTIFLESVDYILYLIYNNFNYEILKAKDYKYIMCPNLNSCPMVLNRVKIFYYIKTSNYLFFKILLDINFGNKSVSHVIKVEFVVTLPKKMVKIISLKILGENPEDTKPYFPTTNELKIFPNGKYKPETGYYKSSEVDTIYTPTDKEVEQQVKKYIDRQLESGGGKLEPEYSCYGSTGNNRIECESNIDTYYRAKPRGVWDRKCVKDSECPFYKANRNYNNSRGGCINGTCEMPLGIKKLGNRYFDLDYTPKCYNCSNNCCKFPNPDYIFPNDYFPRLLNLSQLKSKGLDII